MTSHGAVLTPLQRRCYEYGIIAVSLLGIATFVHLWLGRMGVGWDLAVYGRGAVDFLAGRDVYRLDEALICVCHPLVLRWFAAIQMIVPLTWFLFAGYAATLAWFGIELRYIFPRKPALLHRGTVLLAAFAFGGLGTICAMSGNFTTYLHLALVAAILTCLRTQSNHARYGFVALLTVGALIKPYCLVYAIAFFFWHPPRRAVAWGAAVTAAVALVWGVSPQIWPADTTAFLAAVQEQTLGRNDLGFSIYGSIRPLFATNGTALAAHSALALSLLYWAAWYAPRAMRFAGDFANRLLFMAPALTLMNPRMKEYDLVVAVVCLFLFAYRYGTDGRVVQAMFWGLALSLVRIVGTMNDLTGVAGPRLLLKEHIWQLSGLALFYALLYFPHRHDARKIVAA